MPVSLNPLVVFDCMVFLQGAARQKSACGACLELAEHGYVQLCVSQEVLAEVGDVLRRPAVRSRFPSLTDPLVDEFLSRVARFSRVVTPVGKFFSYSRDPKDEPYLNLVIETHAEYLVTRDRDLLDLKTSGLPEAIDFRRRFPTVDILEPLDFLRKLEASDNR